MLRVTLGWHLDRAAHPAPGGGLLASLGEAVLGPMGFLSLLERGTGLGGVQTPPVQRVARYLARMKELADGGAFYAASLEADPWATAELLLTWRDGLVAAGWDADAPEAPQRLADLARLERGWPAPLPPSVGERLRAVLRALPGWPKPPVSEVALVDAEALWPAVWRDIFVRLRADGVAVTEIPCAPQATGGDLAIFQAHLFTGVRSAVGGDGSLAVLACDNETTAAEVVADWLAADANDGVVVVRGPGSALLDGELANRHLPRLGGSSPSPWRTVLQVLPLALELHWEPFRVSRAIELLALPKSPLAGKTGWRLAQALSDEPGLGGEKWQAAVAECLRTKRERLEAEVPTLPAAKVDAAMTELEARIGRWLPERRFRPREGMPVKAVLEITGRVAKWARAWMAGDTDPLLAVAARQADELASVVAQSGLETVTRIVLGHMVENVLGDGVGDASAFAQAAPWRVVDRPGQIWGRTDTVLWCGFVDDGARGHAPPWSAEERQWLDAHGVWLDDPRLHRRREFAAARRATLMAGSRLVLVRPCSVDGAAVGDHTLWTRLAAAFQPERSHLGLVEPVSRLRDVPRTVLAGRTLVRAPALELTLPQPARHWALPADPARGGEKESVTGLEKLLGCPLAYAIAADGLVRSSGYFEVPDENRMLGNLAHKVIQLLFEESRSWSPKDARRRAGELFDELVPKMAAPLLEPGEEAGRRAYREMVARSVDRLVGQLADAKLVVEAVEKPVARTIPGSTVELRGKIDMVAAAASGRRAVVDFKWRGVKKRRTQLAEGTAVQLAAYGWLLETEVGDRADAGFFVLDKARLFFSAPTPFPHAHVEGSDLIADWDRALASYARLRKEVGGGQVVARGVEDEDGADEGLPIVLEPPCGYCEYGALCGANGGAP